jgi:hypothetical protein
VGEPGRRRTVAEGAREVMRAGAGRRIPVPVGGGRSWAELGRRRKEAEGAREGRWQRLESVKISERGESWVVPTPVRHACDLEDARTVIPGGSLIISHSKILYFLGR